MICTEKSEVIWLGTRQQLAKMSEADKDLPLPSGILRASETVRNLGVIIDERLTFEGMFLSPSPRLTDKAFH